MKIDLDKEEMTFLSAAMSEAIIQIDEEIGRTARTATLEDRAENDQLRSVFIGIKAKMDCGITELEER